MRTLVIGDTHKDDPYLDELRIIYDEILSIKADRVVHLGDYYNHNKPTPATLAFGTEIATKLFNKYGDFTLLAGNGRHNWMNGHSVTEYLTYLGVKCVGMEHEEIIDGIKVLYGHHMTNESYKEYGSHFYTVSELNEKYDLVLLGHQHICQDLSPKIFHLGSVFYQSFAEVQDQYKRVAIIENGKWQFIPLKSPIPMIDVHDPAELNNIDSKTKVRLLISDFGTFKKCVNDLGQWKEKFREFKYELRYESTFAKADPKEITEKYKKVSIIDEIVRQVKDTAVRDLLIAQFKE